MNDTELMEPPWLKHPTIPAGSILWRMGNGETYMHEWQDWYVAQSKETRGLVVARFPEPKGWEGFYARREQQFSRGAR